MLKTSDLWSFPFPNRPDYYDSIYAYYPMNKTWSHAAPYVQFMDGYLALSKGWRNA